MDNDCSQRVAHLPSYPLLVIAITSIALPDILHSLAHDLLFCGSAFDLLYGIRGTTGETLSKNLPEFAKSAWQAAGRNSSHTSAPGSIACASSYHNICISCKSASHTKPFLDQCHTNSERRS